MDQIQVGRDNQVRGVQFEEQCADLYRLLRYQVEVGRLFGARQVDLFLTRRLGDVSLRRAIECKAGPIDTNDLDRFALKLNLVRQEYPDALGTLISGVGFTDAVATHASQIGIQLTLFKDLEAQLFDGHAYATRLIDAATSEPRYNPDMYVRPSIAPDADSESQPADEFVAEWLKDPDWRQLTLLGDAGTGKSFLTRMTALRLAKSYLADPSRNPLPILIDLRQAVTSDVADVYEELLEATVEAERKPIRARREQEMEIPGLGVDEWLSEYAAEQDHNIEVGLFIRDVEKLLSPPVWRIVHARYVQGLTLAQIAQAEQLPKAEIHRVIQRAKVLLAARKS